MYLHIYVHMYLHIYVHMYLYTYVCANIHTYIHICVPMCLCTYLLHMYLPTYIKTDIHIYIYQHIYIHNYAHILLTCISTNIPIYLHCGYTHVYLDTCLDTYKYRIWRPSHNQDILRIFKLAKEIKFFVCIHAYIALKDQVSQQLRKIFVIWRTLSELVKPIKSFCLFGFFVLVCIWLCNIPA